MIADGVLPSLHVDYKHTKIKQYHKEGRALRTETTINNPHDFRVSKRLTRPAGPAAARLTTNRRLLGVQTISHDPIRGAKAFTDLTTPVVTGQGTRTLDCAARRPGSRPAPGPAPPPAIASRIHQP